MVFVRMFPSGDVGFLCGQGSCLGAFAESSALPQAVQELPDLAVTAEVPS